MGNERQKKLLEILSEKQSFMTGRQLGAILKVSDRTIRSDVKTINSESSKPVIESDMQSGYRIITGESGYFSEKKRKIGERDELQIPDTSQARCTYIIQNLLFKVKELNLIELQDQIYVSSYTIERDLKRIREMLKAYSNLKLVRNGKRISLQGDELSKRKFYKNLLVAEVQKNFLNLDQLAKLYKEFDLLKVKDIFLKVLEKYDYSLHESLLPMMIVHAGINIERMLHFNYINMGENDENMKETIEYQISSDFFQKVAQEIPIQVRESEINRFAMTIMGRRASNYTSDYIHYEGKWINIKKLADEVIHQIYEVFGIDFRDDSDLNAGLKVHLQGLIEREKNHIHLEDFFVEEIQRKYPLVFEMGIYITEFLGKRLNTKISDIESAFIALHLGAASERMNAASRYRAVAILPYNQSFSIMCVTKLKDMFQERMELVATMHYFEQDIVKDLEPDLILTTTALSHSLDIPTVLISIFVDFNTESNILKTLNELDKKAFHLEFISNIGKLIRKEHYYENLDFDTPEEVIRFLCKDLYEAHAVDESFCEVVLKREEMAPTSFVNTFAIPHAFGSFAKISTIATAQLKHPIQWGNFEVKLVMLFAVNENDQQMIKMFFDWVSNMINHMEKLAQLCIPCGYDQFIDKITE